MHPAESEAPDDPDFRRFLDERDEARRKLRQARPPIWADEPPTDKQVRYLRYLGHRGRVRTKGEAAELIERLVEARK